MSFLHPQRSRSSITQPSSPHSLTTRPTATRQPKSTVRKYVTTNTRPRKPQASAAASRSRRLPLQELVGRPAREREEAGWVEVREEGLERKRIGGSRMSAMVGAEGSSLYVAREPGAVSRAVGEGRLFASLLVQFRSSHKQCIFI